MLNHHKQALCEACRDVTHTMLQALQDGRFYRFPSLIPLIAALTIGFAMPAMVTAEGQGVVISQAVTLTLDEQAWLTEHPTIRVANEMDWSPFDFAENSKPAGFSIDYISLIAAKTGLKLEFINGFTWDQLLQMGRDRQVDLFPAIILNDERVRYLAFTRTYNASGTAIYVRQETNDIFRLDSLLGKRVALVRGYNNFHTITTHYPEIKVVPVDSPLEALRAVTVGDADATIGQTPVFNYLIRKHLISGLKVAGDAAAGKLHTGNELHMAVRSDWVQLVGILEKGMNAITIEEYNRLADKWLNLPAGREVEALIEETPEGESWQKDHTQSLKMMTLLAAGGAILGFLALVFMVGLFSSSKRGSLALSFGTPRFRVYSSIFLALFLAVVSLLTWLALDYNKRSVLSKTRSELQAVLGSTKEGLNTRVADRKLFLEHMGGSKELISLTERLLTVPPNRESLLASKELMEIREYFKAHRRLIGDIGFFIINPDFISIGSMRDVNMGSINLIAEQRRDLLTRVFHGETLFIPPIISDVPIQDDTGKEMPAPVPTMFIATPIRRYDGKIIAVATLRLLPGLEFTRVTQLSRIGETGETYAFDRGGRLLSASRFDDQLRRIGLIEPHQRSILSVEIRDPGGNIVTGFRSSIPRAKQPLTRMAESAVKGESGIDMHGYRDYRGVQVFGAWFWDDFLGFGLATEINMAEALGIYHVTRLTTLGVFGVTVVLSFGMALFTLVMGERANRAISRARDDLEQRVEERTTKLSESEHRLTLALRGGNLGSWDTNLATGETIINERCAEIFGYSLDEIPAANAQKMWKNSIHPDDRNRALKAGRYYKAGRLPGYESEYRIITKAGQEKWIISAGAVVERDERGDAIRMVGTVLDITRRKQIEEELRSAEAKNRLILEAAGEGIYGLNLAGHTTFVNPAATRMIGYEPEELLNKPQHAIIHHTRPDNTPYPREECPIYAAFKDGQVHHVADEVFWRKDGSCFPVEYTSTPILQGGVLTGAVVTFRDISERMAVETALKVASEEAKAANRAKSEFLSSMSHELRTPLNAILGFAQLLDIDDEEPLTETQRESVDHIMKGGQHLLELINEILDLAKIEAGRIDLAIEDLSLQDLIEECMALAQPIAKEFNIHLRGCCNCTASLYVKADYTRFKQVLFNLISNAIKYNCVGGKVELSCSGSGDAQIRICVMDTGKGISTEKQAGLFQPFNRLDAEGTEIEGTGIGLTITKRLIEAMGGKIGLESEVGKGTKFWIDIPQATHATVQSNGLGIGNEGKEKDHSSLVTKVLYIEDNPANQQLMEKIMAKLPGMELLIESNAEIGLATARKGLPDLILMDINLPGMTGIDALAKIRQTEEIREVPVIAVSAAAMPRDIERGMKAGFAAYIAKPFDVSGVWRTIREVLLLKGNQIK